MKTMLKLHFNMLIEIFIALFFVFIQPTIHHYIGDLDECTLSKICNHTWVPLCGFNADDSNYKLFLDDCDMHEYNCDYNTTYKEVDVKVCSEKCTKKDHPTPASTTPMPPHTKVSTSSTKTNPTEVSPIITTREVTEPTTDKTDTSTIFVESSTVATTTEKPLNNATIVTETTTGKTVTTTEKFTEKSTVKPEEKDNDKTIPVEKTQETKTTPVTSKSTLGCNHSCNLPSTWETTSVGETRDFAQILREKYGDRVKFLRHTTHFPKKPDRYIRRSDSFVPGSHSERQYSPLMLFKR